MTEDGQRTNRALVAQRTETIHPLRQDTECRSDPVLEASVHAPEPRPDRTTHAHDRALEHQDRSAGLERGQRGAA